VDLEIHILHSQKGIIPISVLLTQGVEAIIEWFWSVLHFCRHLETLPFTPVSGLDTFRDRIPLKLAANAGSLSP